MLPCGSWWLPPGGGQPRRACGHACQPSTPSEARPGVSVSSIELEGADLGTPVRCRVEGGGAALAGARAGDAGRWAACTRRGALGAAVRGEVASSEGGNSHRDGEGAALPLIDAAAGFSGNSCVLNCSLKATHVCLLSPPVSATVEEHGWCAQCHHACSPVPISYGIHVALHTPASTPPQALLCSPSARAGGGATTCFLCRAALHGDLRHALHTTELVLV